RETDRSRDRSYFGPDWNEVIPLIGVLANQRSERVHDLLGELGAALAGSKVAAIIVEFGQKARGVCSVFFDNAAADYRATGGSSEVGSGKRGLELATQQLDGSGALRSGAINQHRDGGDVLQTVNDYDERKRVLSDHDG